MQKVADSNLKQELKAKILSEIDFSHMEDDTDISGYIDRYLIDARLNELPLSERLRLRMELFNSIRRLDVLTELLEDEQVTEIMVNGFDNIFIEKNGCLLRTEKTFESEERLISVIQQIASDCNRRVNEASPILDARLKDGSRVNIVLAPVSLNGSTVTIRKFPDMAIGIDRLIELGSISNALAKVLNSLVVAGYNIFVSGGTGSGKTTFLNALSSFIPRDERVVTIEDSAELRLNGISNLVRLEARSANIEGENAVSIRSLIKSSLRMRPDRIIVGEVRDEAVIDMLAAMNTGHDGSLSTGHANSCEDMLLRLESMYLMGFEIPVSAIRRQIASAVDIVIHLGRLRDRSRRVLKVCEVAGMDGGEIKLNTLFEFVEQGEVLGRISGVFVKVNDILNVDKLMAKGVYGFYKEACDEFEVL